MTEAQPPPVPWQFTGQPELYHMAVRLYLDSVVTRAQERTRTARPVPADVIAVLRDDALALKRQHEEEIGNAP